jgi:cobalamin biosynthesis Mg chelatase CobN
MPNGRAYAWRKISQRMRVLASLAPLFALALVLAWLLSSETALSFFESPASPLPPTEAGPSPTGTPVLTEAGPTPTPPSPETLPTSTSVQPPAEEATTPTSLPPEETPADTTPSSEEQREPTSQPTEAAFIPAVGAASHATPSSTGEASANASAPVWPWVLLGILSVGAMAAGVFLLRREPVSEDEAGSVS